MNRRYGNNNTAPYGIEKRGSRFEDGALSRGIGTLVNHKPEGRDNVALKDRHHTIWIKALKNIKNGQELYADYGKDYVFDKRNVRYSTNNNKKKI